MHKLHGFWDAIFAKIQPFFVIFSRISPVGNSPKVTIRNSRIASEFLENLVEKRASFFDKIAVFTKSRPHYQKMEKIFSMNFGAFLKNDEKSLDFKKLEQLLFWTISKNTLIFTFSCFFTKNPEGLKKANSCFSKNSVFS
jgi:hypothetical protein